MPKVLLITDRPNWSYHTIARGIAKYNPQKDVEFVIKHFKGDLAEIEATHKDYDLVFPMAWQLAGLEKRGFLPWKKRFVGRLDFWEPEDLVTGIHSHRTWDDGKTRPGYFPLPPTELVDFLRSFKGVNAISRRLYGLFREAGLDNLSLTEAGVDVENFKPSRPLNTDRKGPLRIGFSGSRKNKKHDFLKGVSQFILPLAKLTNVELKLAMPHEECYVPLEEMPQYYNDIDVYLCVSNSEGLSQSVLEACACGRPLVSTRVGGNEDILQDGKNGFFVERDFRQIAERIEFFEKNRDALLSMGLANRRIIEEKWSWQVKIKAWMDFIRSRIS